MLTGITRGVSPCLGDCELSFLPRREIDVRKATRQHQAYEQCLTKLGVQIVSLPSEPEFPDAVFVEDPAVVVDEVAVITPMGTEVRGQEAKSLATALSPFRPLKFMSYPARLEGGDIMRVGRTLYVGGSRRTNHAGMDQLAEILLPYGYQVCPVDVKGCLHLKTGCSYLGRNTLLVNQSWVDTAPLKGFDVIDIPTTEPWAANALVIEDVILLPTDFPQTGAILEDRGFHVQTIDVSELMKAEAGLTCMSIIFDSFETTISRTSFTNSGEIA
jgi:dimethylargininase